MASGWRYILARSSDRGVIGELRHSHDRTLAVDLNKSGSAGFWVPTKDELSRLIVPWSTCILAQYNDTIEWSGPVITRSTSLAQGKATVSAVGWFERLMHLNVQDLTLTFDGYDAGVIVSNLLDVAHAQDPALPITFGTNELTQHRTITYQRGQSIGQAIIDLTELEAGFDWEIDPVTLELNIFAKRGQDRKNCKWTYIDDGISKKGNLQDVVELLDGSVLVNDIRPQGKFGYGSAIDVVSQATYGVFQENPSLSNVVDNNILDAYANAEIVYRSNPRVTYTLSPKSNSDSEVPKLFVDFDIGDTTYLTARKDYMNVADQAERIFGVSLAIADNGSMTINNLQTTAS